MTSGPVTNGHCPMGMTSDQWLQIPAGCYALPTTTLRGGCDYTWRPHLRVGRDVGTANHDYGPDGAGPSIAVGD